MIYLISTAYTGFPIASPKSNDKSFAVRIFPVSTLISPFGEYLAAQERISEYCQVRIGSMVRQ
jgi:hypothetical protein